MKSSHLSISALIALFLTGCSHPSSSISDIDASITRQFKQQWQQRKDSLDKRLIKEVHIGKFYKPSGNDAFYAEIEVLADDRRIITGSPIIPLGNSCFGVSFSMPDGPTLNAVVSVDR